MPRATVNTEDTTRYDLKTVPEGFVVLRRMTYGQYVARRELTKLSVESSGRNKDFKGELAMANKLIAKFELEHCVVDHNLEDENGQKLVLHSERDFERLDPRVGQELETLIGNMNNFDDEPEGN